MQDKSLFSGFIFGAVRHLYRLVTNRHYRQYACLCTRFGNVPRYTEFDAHVIGRRVTVIDGPSFLSAFYEIFVRKVYKFVPATDCPVVLDLGANIGLSVLFFKLFYPNSKIVAYEADPYVFNILKRNVGLLSDVTLVNKAIWKDDRGVVFDAEGADGGHVVPCGNVGNRLPSASVKEVLAALKPEFVKMDIEGAENLLINECRGKVNSVRWFFCEYHSLKNEKQNLSGILSFFEDEGFKYKIFGVDEPYSPMLFSDVSNCFDVQLNIYAYRP